MSNQPTEPWYKSKTKVGGVLLGVSTMTYAAGSYLTDAADPITAVTEFMFGLGAILAIFGYRNSIQK